MDSSPSPPLPVLIIGAGLSGLTLAQGLKKHRIPFEIYERDPAFNTRPQGYRIRLNLVGLHALRTCLPEEVSQDVWRTAAEFVPGLGRVDAVTGRSMGAPVIPISTTPSASNEPASTSTSTPTSGTPSGPGASNSHDVPHIPPPPGIDPDDPLTRLAMSSRLPVDRATLRSVLLTDLKDHIHLSKQFTHYTITPHSVIAHFTDRTTASGSLLIGADGYRSRVTRQLLGPDTEKLTPIDMGARMIYGKSPLTPELQKEMNHEFKYGIRIAHAPSKPTLFLETCRFQDHPSCPTDYVFWVLTDPNAFSNLVESDTALLGSMSEEAANLAERAVEGYHESARAVIEHQDRACTSVWAMTCAPPASEGGLYAWKTERRVTVLGDAVHPMPPTGGLGGNAAMRSAASLVRILARRGGQISYGNGDGRSGGTNGTASRRGVPGIDKDHALRNGEHGPANDTKGNEHEKDENDDEADSEESGDGWTEAEISEYEDRMRSEAGRMVTLAHAGATGTYPLSLWKPLLGDAMERISEEETRKLNEALDFR